MTRVLLVALSLLFSVRAFAVECDQLGDFAVGAVVDCDFPTAVNGAPFALAGSPVVSVYCGNNTTESTTGLTLTAPFDGQAGLNHIRFDTSTYSAGQECSFVVTTGTVNGVSVVGAVVGGLSLSHNSSLKPTTDGRKLDVTATGGAGIDWGNVENQTTVVALTNTTISSTAPTAAQNAAAVWDYLTASATTANSMGAYILAKLALWSSDTTPVLQSGLDQGVMTVYVGDAYTSTHDRRLPFAELASTPDLTGATMTLIIVDKSNVEMLSTTCTIVSSGGAEQEVGCNLTAAQTTLLDRIAANAYNYQLEAVWAADNPSQPAVIAEGTVTTKRKY